MFKLIVYGRGGQGAKTLAMLLAESAIDSGSYAQAYPEFGPERTGAPVCAYLRISSEKILTKEPIKEPDLVVFLDDSLLQLEEVKKVLVSSSLLLINTEKDLKQIKTDLSQIDYQGKIYLIDTQEIITEYDSKIHFSAPLIGRMLKIKEFISLEALKKTYENKFQNKIPETVMDDTLKAIEDGFYKL